VIRHSLHGLLIFLFGHLAQGCHTVSFWTSTPEGVPHVVLPALCSQFIEVEDIDASTKIFVQNETSPIFRTFALRTLHSAGELTPAEALADDARDALLEAHFRPEPLGGVRRDGRCKWALADRSAPALLGSNLLLLELSGVTEDPFAQDTSERFGVFARLSFGRASGASWYWVQLVRTGESWESAAAVQLAISDG
jgi:hypothetical protein